MAKGQLGQMLAAAAGVAASDSGSGGAMAAQMANQMMQLRYGRKDELESDSYGLRYMVDAGYHPGEMVRVMQNLKAASGGGGRGPDFMSSHPDPDARVAAIEQFLRDNQGKFPGTLTTGRSLRNSADRFQVR
jgi:predicted Zn-dependent protease